MRRDQKQIWNAMLVAFAFGWLCVGSLIIYPLALTRMYICLCAKCKIRFILRRFRLIRVA